MDFMSSSSSFHSQSSTTAPPPNHHHHRRAGGTPASEDAGEDSEDLTTMPLFSRSSEANASTVAVPAGLVEKEHMFDKVVTPSDVGKLNRLVIPKQHAEKYFPLDSSTNEKGLFLNFEDRNGKPWRFRYSYWNSSQSYVMTKGWSRFVKEKKLDAGDIVSFQRGLGELGRDRLFIDWRRRPDAMDHHHHHHHQLLQPSFPLHHQFSYHRSLIPWTSNTGGNNPMVYQPQHHHYGNASTSPYGCSNTTTIVNGNPCPPGSVMYLRSDGVGSEYGFNYGSQQYPVMHLQRSGGGGGNNGGGNNSNSNEQQLVFDSVPVVQGKAAAKRLRLFGVNMDCPVQESDECDGVLSNTATWTNHQAPPLLHSYGGFGHHSSSSSSLSVPPLRLGPYNDEDDEEEEDDDDKGKGAAMSLDLEI